MKAVSCLLCQKTNFCQLLDTEFFKEATLAACKHRPQAGNGSSLPGRKGRVTRADAAGLRRVLWTEDGHPPSSHPSFPSKRETGSESAKLCDVASTSGTRERVMDATRAAGALRGTAASPPAEPRPPHIPGGSPTRQVENRTRPPTGRRMTARGFASTTTGALWTEPSLSKLYAKLTKFKQGRSSAEPQ